MLYPMIELRLYLVYDEPRKTSQTGVEIEVAIPQIDFSKSICAGRPEIGLTGPEVPRGYRSKKSCPGIHYAC